jgi:ribonuclease HI
MNRDAQLLLALADALDVAAALGQLKATPAELKSALRRGAGALDFEEKPSGAPPADACTCVETPGTGPGAELGAVVIHTDGASRGNPGPAAAGLAIYCGGKLVEAAGQYLGRMTNNQAEYNALLLALKRARELGAESVTIRTDSELMVRQIMGRYRVKDPHLQKLFAAAKDLIRAFASFRVEHVPREQNQKADAMANRAIDEFQSD